MNTGRPPQVLPDSGVLLTRLHTLHPKGIDLSLERLARLLEAMGNPQRRLPPVIHVAGTNGKGSTVAFMRAILEAAGLRVHVYTSPHLVRFHERIRLAGTLIDEVELCARLQACELANDGQPITFFEITTAAAFAAFAETDADILLLEVGLGGRYDTTNIIEQAAVTAITPVDLDHQAFLGDSLAGIAGEKAGILKPATPAIIGPQKPDAEEVIARQIREIGCPAFWYGQDWTCFVENGRFIYQYTDGLLDLPLPALSGHHQIINAGTAIACLQALPGREISSDAIAAGLARVNWPGRLQRLTSGPLTQQLPDDAELWLDGGHNPAAGRALAESLADMEERDPRPLILVCGMLENKDASGFLEAFCGLAGEVRTVPIPDEEASMNAPDMAQAAAGLGFAAYPEPDVGTALAAISQQGGPPPRVVITGSLYLAGAVLRANGIAPD